jgi:3-oxoacyl-[acyl-carrier protein] reductase
LRPVSRVLVVSGAGRGLGQAIALHRLEQGDTVCALSRTPTDFVRRALDDHADRFFFEPVRIDDHRAVEAFVRVVADRFGGIDGLVNNAAIVRDGLLATAPYEDIDSVVDTNLRGTLFLTRACLRAMLAGRKGGRIINISSIAAGRGFRGLSVYAATKAALDAVTRTLAREVGERDITVNSIAPGYLDTAMSAGLGAEERRRILGRTPLGRLGTAADILPAVDFLLSPGAAFITGQVLVIDGGLTA